MRKPTIASCEAVAVRAGVGYARCGRAMGSNEDRARRAVDDVKETEDLLAGFDRPGRPGRTRKAGSQRDFVDYHLDRRKRLGQGSEAERAPPSEAGREPGRRDHPTAIIP